MTRIYLVDSENIGASWSQLLSSMSKEDKMFVFYTEKSPYISYDNLLQVIAHCDIPTFIKCYEGKNALDFQLVSELGFKLCQEPEAEFIIISDDYGYDPAIRYWKERMFNVHRIGKKNCKPMSSRKMEESVIAPVMMEEAAKETEDFAEQQPVAEVFVAQVKDEEADMEFVQVPEAEDYAVEEADRSAEEIQQPAVEIEQEEKEKSTEQFIAADEAEAVSGQTEPELKETEEDLAGEQETSDVHQDSLKENQPQKRTKERRKKHKKELAKEPENVVEQSDEKTEENSKPSEKDMATEVAEENVLDLLLLEIVNKCKSMEPMKDAFSVKEMFCSFSMSNLTDVNTALKSLIGNEVGNDIYRELKERQECRALLDELYIPDAKRRFKKYVQIVVDRTNLEGITAKEIGDFLYAIPRKNLNSIRSAMIKEYGHDQGSMIYTIFKPHIKVLNNI